ncbi:MAG: ABC transporter permease [Chloroflexi bacterium]|jgi:ABC-2 type transport system permease protein|nr:ABC transporter permease [Chloroflexota bacterium]MBT4072851.1 ABC transporter permease [Chloroflexota bacterium]MBT4514087.1 ABC transporter permease [Chloroflexota bacterium]
MSVAFSLTVASLKMYFRNRQAIFFSLFIPLLIMVIFGLLDFDRFSGAEIGIVDQAQNETSAAVIGQLSDRADDLVEIEIGSLSEERERLEEGRLDALVIIPAGFGDDGAHSVVEAISDERSPQRAALAITLVAQVMGTVANERYGPPPDQPQIGGFSLEQTSLRGDDRSYTAFLVPGIVAMSIMQLGIFGVVFALLQFRQQGVLRRLRATPVNPAQFLFAQISTRLSISVLQTLVLLFAGIILFDVAVGNSDILSWVMVIALAILGGILFVTMGLAISGFARTEEVAAPVTNLVSMPMMFLSGVFFPLDALPDVVTSVTQFLPLTYLADAIRAVVTDGAGVTDIWGELAGLAAWTAIVFGLATRVFRWE